jgi:hypothetical protein
MFHSPHIRSLQCTQLGGSKNYADAYCTLAQLRLVGSINNVTTRSLRESK